MLAQLKRFSQTKTNLIFDFDKTIAQLEINWTDWHPGIAKIYAQFDPNHGYEFGQNPHTFHNQLVSQFGAPLVQATQAFVSDYEQEYVTGFTPYPELIDFISSNQTNNMFILSSNAKVTVEAGLTQFGILSQFKTIITRDDVALIKPDPEGLLLIDACNTDKDSCLLIGDSKADKAAAAAAGIDFLQCTYFGSYV